MERNFIPNKKHLNNRFLFFLYILYLHLTGDIFNNNIKVFNNVKSLYNAKTSLILGCALYITIYDVDKVNNCKYLHVLITQSNSNNK